MQHIHLLGICGTGMAALAGILKEQGFHISGSDEHAYPPMSTFLEGLGIQVQNGYSAANLNPRPDLAVVGNVIRRDNPEAQALLATDIPRLSLPEALNRFLVDERRSLVVAGTHGKSTTTALVAWLLYAIGQDPGFMVGGLARNFQANYRVGRGPYVALEGDEYDTAFFDKRPKFVHFRPRVAVLTSIEFDHADIYTDLDHVIRAFETYLETVAPDGQVLAWGDAALVRQVCGCGGNVSFYGQSPDCQWRATEIRPSNGGMQFTAWRDGAPWGEFFLPMIGRHNVWNALAALAALAEVGAEPGSLKEALAGFKGVHKRQEVAGEFRGVMVMQDFAHHPTAVALTLAAVRQGFPSRRLVAVFEPRTNTSRRRIFQEDYAKAFQDADIVFVREPPDLWKVEPEEQFSSQQLVADLTRQGKQAAYFPDTDQLLAGLLPLLAPGDLVLVMSNGDFDHLVPRLCEALKED
ncbi:MAG: UDP-N-acetylmuramate:L-alanyl-gamma-D-glutamyl-meso-diaminopimelate ligase [Deltaproteobacteria bacterium]|nr:UDP-N-acetylmuramate:L-alanyl-gamma-D-glutamyl-meso-diaminopimelate ligase [Deltaproteobacteria bacterium]